jgi:hypothetical protein
MKAFEVPCGSTLAHLHHIAKPSYVVYYIHHIAKPSYIVYWAIAPSHAQCSLSHAQYLRSVNRGRCQIRIFDHNLSLNLKLR